MFWRKRHPVSHEDLSAHADGELGERQAVAVSAHVESCAACRAELTELRSTRLAVARLPRAQAPRSFAVRGADVATPTPPARAARGSARAQALLGGVAMVAAVVFIAIVAVDAGETGPGSSENGDDAGLLFDENAEEAADTGADEVAPEVPEAADGQAATDDSGQQVGEGDASSDGDAEAPEGRSAGDDATPAAEAPAALEDGDDGDEALDWVLAAEVATLAIAIVGGAGFAFARWRRRA
jgi:hypothetical protein